MSIETNGTPVLAKLHANVLARPYHGLQGWWKGQAVIYYENLGWVTVDECVENAKKEWPSGTVFASRSSFTPAVRVLHSFGWRWYGHGLRRTQVVFTDAEGWVSLAD